MERGKTKLLNGELHHTSQPIGVFRWRANPKAGTTIDDVMDPAYWENVQKDRFTVTQPWHQGQVIEVLPEDETFFAELLVLRLKNGNIALRKLNYSLLTNKDTKVDESDFEIKHRGKSKWSIIRKDGVVIDEHIDTESEAHEKLLDYLTKA
jgi:hypothetical protein